MDENDLTTRAAAERVVAALAAAGETLAVAESLTGGLLAASVVAVPGASQVFLGGIVAYATDAKQRLLAVEPAALEATGPVDPTVAVQMAVGARWRLDATWSLSTTGVAGPDPQPGDPGAAEVGTVYLGIAGPRIAQSVHIQLSGARDEIRSEAVRQGLLLLGIALGVVDTIGVEQAVDSLGTEQVAGGDQVVDGEAVDGEEAVDGNNADVSRVPHM